MTAKRLGKVLSAAMMLMAGVSPADELKLAVAANFTDATREIIPLFEKSSGHSVKASFGSTGKLFSQIENGAPFQAFLAADSKTPKKAEQQGLAVPGTRFTYARGRLVMWSAKRDLFADGQAYLKSGAFARAAIANPQTAPGFKRAATCGSVHFNGSHRSDPDHRAGPHHGGPRADPDDWLAGRSLQGERSGSQNRTEPGPDH